MRSNVGNRMGIHLQIMRLTVRACDLGSYGEAGEPQIYFESQLDPE